MRLNKYFSLIILSLVLNRAIGNVYIDSLLPSKYRTTKPASILLFSAGYKMPINKNNIINSGHGLCFEAGINPGRLISKNLIIGLYAGWAFMDRFWATSFNKNFTNDYSNSIQKENNFSGLDSSIIYSSENLLKNKSGTSITQPGCEMNSFHNYSLYYGIIIRLPYKYIPTLKLYKGTTRTHYQGDGNIATNKKEYNIYELRREMYGLELMILNTNQFLKRKKKKENRGGGLSIYYEISDFYNSSIYFYDGETRRNMSLKKYVSSSFLKKYKYDMNYGVKLSFYIL